MAFKTSAAGRATLIKREGCRLKSYQDSVGVWTIGVGHTGRATPPPVGPDMRISQADADAMLAADLVPFEEAVYRAISRPMTQNQFDAFVSLAFNIGATAFTASTAARKFNAGDIAGAADAFLLWVRPPELKGRRQDERAQFLSPDRSAGSVDAGTGLGGNLQGSGSWLGQIFARLKSRVAG
jgi:lysozyme